MTARHDHIAHLLLNWYERHGRAHLPWRRTRDPYSILVSEFMLQQTQVDRVLPKYEAFLARFPGVASLAAATTADVLRMWQGLGYNSRAVRLKQIAQMVVDRFGGVMPSDEQTLRSLPGIGPYSVTQRSRTSTMLAARSAFVRSTVKSNCRRRIGSCHAVL